MVTLNCKPIYIRTCGSFKWPIFILQSIFLSAGTSFGSSFIAKLCLPVVFVARTLPSLKKFCGLDLPRQYLFGRYVADVSFTVLTKPRSV